MSATADRNHREIRHALDQGVLSLNYGETKLRAHGYTKLLSILLMREFHKFETL